MKKSFIFDTNIIVDAAQIPDDQDFIYLSMVLRLRPEIIDLHR